MKKLIRSIPKISALSVVDIPIEDLIPDEDNPNEMDEATFDQLIEEIREQGFDEPIQVRPHPTMKGKYQIAGGHHRVKAATVLGMQSVPAVIKNFSDREQKVALVKRNALRGELNKGKLVKLYQTLAKGRDPVQVQRELGFTNTKRFELMIDEVSKTLTPKQKKQLAAAKEDIKSMDDLSSVLNRIFKESGSELDKGYMVFSFGGKRHHYFQIDEGTDKLLQSIVAEAESRGMTYTEAVQLVLVLGADFSKFPSKTPAPAAKPAVKKRIVKKPAK